MIVTNTCQCQKHKCRMSSPHNEIYNLCVFAIYLKNRFCGHGIFVLQTSMQWMQKYACYTSHDLYMTVYGQELMILQHIMSPSTADTDGQLKKVKVSVFISHSFLQYMQGAQVWITQFYLQLHQCCLYLVNRDVRILQFCACRILGPAQNWCRKCKNFADFCKSFHLKRLKLNSIPLVVNFLSQM